MMRQLRRRHRPGGDHDHHQHHHGEPGGRGRMRHGDVRAAILQGLTDGPAHGYELGQRLLRASGGAWQPSPGSIYPTLQTLADEDLVTSEDREGKRIYTLTRRGQAEVDQRAKRGAGNPWEGAYGDEMGELREAIHGLKMAVKQVAAVGTPEQCAKVQAIVAEARGRIYELLAQG